MSCFSLPLNLSVCILLKVSKLFCCKSQKSFVEGLKIISLKVLKVFFQKSKQYFVESPKSISLKVPTRQVKNTSLKVSKMFRQAGCRGKSRTNDLSLLLCSAAQKLKAWQLTQMLLTSIDLPLQYPNVWDSKCWKGKFLIERESDEIFGHHLCKC